MRRLLVALALLLAPRLATAQDLVCDPGDLEVRDVNFTGNEHFNATQLENVIVTTPSSWARRNLHLPIGARRCLDSLEVARDAVRLRLFYRQRGYYHTAVSSHVAPEGPGAVSVGFQIAEGPPVVIDSVEVTGLDSVPQHASLLRRLERFEHRIYNRVELDAMVDTVVERLHNSGYPFTDRPLTNDSVDAATNRAFVRRGFIYVFRDSTYLLLPARRAHIDSVAIQIVPGHDSAHIGASTVRKLLSFKPGKVYRERDLVRSQRDLYQLETYRHVDIALDSVQRNDTSLTVVVRLDEGKMNNLRVGGGWATLDCLRTQARFTNRDFLGGARRLELNGRLSHIQLCRKDVETDTIGSGLNYYASGTLRLPTLFGPRNIPSITLYSERTSEFRAYLRETQIGGAAEVTRDLKPRFDLRAGLPLTFLYRIEYGRTRADPAVFCQLFNRCNLSDISRLQQNGSLRVFSAGLVRDRSDNLLDPSTGSIFRLELRSGATSVDTGSASRFNRATAEFSAYGTFGRSTLAARVQFGAVLEGFSTRGATTFVPPEERLYAGGPNSVRGYNQNLLGPVVYIVDSATISRDSSTYHTVDSTRVLQYSPTGGNTSFVGNLEWRVRTPLLNEGVQLAAFVDAGLVWNRPRESPSLGDLRVTPGVGVRVQSPIGPVRVDVAYNRYTNAPGAAYYLSQNNVLRCVSPNNTFVQGQITDGSECPATFVPSANNAFLSRLTFHLSIGQAF